MRNMRNRQERDSKEQSEGVKESRGRRRRCRVRTIKDRKKERGGAEGTRCV